MKEKSAPLSMVLAMTVFGTIGIFRTYIPLPSGVVALFRGVVGTLFFLLLQMILRKKFSPAALKKNLILLCVSGALIGFNWIFLFEAYRRTSIATATMCYYMSPVFVILLSPLLLREKITCRKGVCAAVALLGMVLVSGVWESGLYGLDGILFGLGAAVMYAAVVLMNKYIHGLSAWERTVVQLGAASVALAPYVLLAEQVDVQAFTGPVVWLLLLLGVVHTGVAYALYFGSLRSLPAQTAALLSYIDPLVAVILSVLVLRENLSVPAAVGVVLVLGAMVVCELKPKKRTAC